MQRLTARFLLLFALIGTFLPTALQASVAPPRACCLRMAHHCHESSGTGSQEPVFRDASCCDHNCCRGVATSQCATPEQPAAASFSIQIAGSISPTLTASPTALRFTSNSTRAPPAC